MRKISKEIRFALVYLTAFFVWTALLCFVDRQPIGPQGSAVGFATVNGFFHTLFGVHLSLYSLTDLLSLIPLGLVFLFGCLGLVQWIGRKSVAKVDFDLLALGGFYLAVGFAFLFFEFVPVNYRPVFIDGVLEVSYPSSTTMLMLSVLLSAKDFLRDRVPKKSKKIVLFVLSAFAWGMVLLRLWSGVHWFSDIIGGILLSEGLVYGYRAALQRKLALAIPKEECYNCR